MDKDSSEYSASKAPETRTPAEERDETVDSRLTPGGAEPHTHSAQGMAGLERDDVPGLATDSGQTRYRDTGKDEVVSEGSE
ncbi:MAG TPA: hypothetical protein VJ813_17960 [Vicinamibacterales bacterium]|nr:hypothetical protein [Vicinamibacterales bacterium]